MYYNQKSFIIFTEVEDWSHQFSNKEKLAKPGDSPTSINTDQTNFSRKTCANTVYLLCAWGPFQFVICKISSHSEKKVEGGMIRGLMVSGGFEGWTSATTGSVGSHSCWFCIFLSLSSASCFFILRLSPGSGYWQPRTVSFFKLLIFEKSRVSSMTALPRWRQLAYCGACVHFWAIAVDEVQGILWLVRMRSGGSLWSHGAGQSPLPGTTQTE